MRMLSRMCAWLLAAMLLGASRSAEAFPQSWVHERNWGMSAEWVSFRVPAGAPRVVTVRTRTTRTLCSDPLGRTLCAQSLVGRIDALAHVFNGTLGNEVDRPLHCQQNTCAQTFTLTAGLHAVLVHGGPRSEGIHTVVVEIEASGAALRPPATVRFADNVVIEINEPPDEFEVHSVLVPDGPTAVDNFTGTVLTRGNLANDWLGVDSTEAWLLDSEFRVVDADLAMTGVGPAAFLPSDMLTARDADGGVFSRGRYVMVRPYRAVPFELAKPGSLETIPSDNAEYARAPGAGRMRVLINPRTDFDGDRVGDRLEDQLGTCSGRFPFTSGNDEARTGPLRRSPCMIESALRSVIEQSAIGGLRTATLRADPRDTDGDGLSDGAEILGTDVVSRWRRNGDTLVLAARRTGVAQTLPLWGFDPRHKDMLIEIDRERYPSNPASCTRPTDGCDAERSVYPIPSFFSREAAFGELWTLRRQWATLPSRRVNNPDGLDGVEVHFDVRFAAASNGHGGVPQVVPTRLDAAGRTEEFGKAGFIVYVPNGRSGSLCSCSLASAQPDDRHWGLSRWWPANTAGGAQAGFGFFNAVPAYNIASTGSHEFGHFMGLGHGAPFADPSNPFAPRSASDESNEDKIVYPTMMTYAYDYRTGAAENRARVHGGAAFSVGRNYLLPLPRAFEGTDGALSYGWPEQNVFAATGRDRTLSRTDVISLWGARQTPSFNYALADCLDGNGRPVGLGTDNCTSVDFDRNGRAEPVVVTNAIEPSSTEVASATRVDPQDINRLEWWCDDAIPARKVPFGTPCCPRGTARVAGADGAVQCRAPSGALVAPSLAELHTMFMQAQPASFVANRRMYSVMLDDEVSADDSPSPPRRCTEAFCDLFTERGKARWQAMDRIVDRVGRVVGQCGGVTDDCGQLLAGRPARGDLLVDGRPWIQPGRGSFAASVARDEANVERIMVASVSRSGAVCFATSGDPTTHIECGWSGVRVAAGRAADIEGAGLRTVTIPGAPAAVSGVAIAAIAAASSSTLEWLVVLRESVGRTLAWSRCNVGDTVTCSRAQPLSADIPTAESQIALAVPNETPPRRAALVTVNRGNALKFHFLSFLGPRIAIGAERLFRRSDDTAVLADTESAVSAAFDRENRLVVGAEATERQALVTSSVSPLSTVGDLPSIGPQFREYNQSRALVRRAAYSPTRPPEALVGTPGVTFSVFFDGRTPLEAVAPRDDGTRNTDLDRAFTGRVRGFSAGYSLGPQMFFAASVEARPLAPRFDYDETAVMAFNVCRTLERPDGGSAGGDLQPRRLSATVGGADALLLCPAATTWTEGLPINNAVADLVVWPRRLRPGEDVERIAEIVTSTGWHGQGAIEAPSEASTVRSTPPVGRCTVGGETGGWMQWLSRGGPR